MLDCVVIRAVDMTFDLFVRRGDEDLPIATWFQHFEPKPGVDFTATEYELVVPGASVGFESGDVLIWRYAASNTNGVTSWIPNGDGVNNMGRIPSFTLPK